jgi:hypothetical protein
MPRCIVITLVVLLRQIALSQPGITTDPVVGLMLTYRDDEHKGIGVWCRLTERMAISTEVSYYHQVHDYAGHSSSPVFIDSFHSSSITENASGEIKLRYLAFREDWFRFYFASGPGIGWEKSVDGEDPPSSMRVYRRYSVLLGGGVELFAGQRLSIGAEQYTRLSFSERQNLDGNAELVITHSRDFAYGEYYWKFIFYF